MAVRKIPVAAVQPQAHDRSGFIERWPRITALVSEAGRRGAKLIVLPEGTVPAYVLGTEAVEPQLLAEAERTLAEIAQRYVATIVYGTAKIVNGKTFNAAVAIGPGGTELGYAAKQFLWHFDRRWFAPGASLTPVDTPAGKLGLLVCADGRIPTIAATLAERGAEILVMPTAWVTSGRDPGALENVQADFMASTRARENGLPFVAANKAGVELESVAYCGKSVIYDAEGDVVARAGEREETIVFGEVSLGSSARGTRAEPFAWRETSGAGASRDALRPRARIAFTAATLPADVARFAALAVQADADVLLAPCPAEGAAWAERVVALGSGGLDALTEAAGVRVGSVSSGTFSSPRGLVDARLAGIDLFVWHASGDERERCVGLARTRAAELRAYIVVFEASGERAFAVDPDGAVVAGTFEGYRLAAFAYDRARSGATTVAPATDVLEGLHTAEAIRARAGAGTALV